MAFTRTQAKALCNSPELDMFDKSRPKLLKQLTAAEVKSLVNRSRKLRDKWREVSQRQTRNTQAAKGQRHTEDNARSADKAALFEQVHQAFVKRMEAVEAGKTTATPGEKVKPVPKPLRAKANRAARTIVQDKLDSARDKANAKLTEANRAAVAEREAAKQPPPKPLAAQAKNSPDPLAAKPAPRKPTKKTNTSKKASLITKSRKKRLQKKEEILAENPDMVTMARPAKNAVAGAAPPKSQTNAHNRTPHAIASQKRVARGGGTRLQGHVSSVNKRSQSRRDSKG